MSRKEQARLGAALEGVQIQHETPPEDPSGHGRLRVWLLFALAAAAAITFLVTYLVWPWRYRDAFGGQTTYRFYNVVIGCSFGIAVLALGLGLIAYVKSLVPDEIAVQHRDHDGPSDTETRATTAALLIDAAEDVGLAHRPVLRRTALAAGGLFGLSTAFLALGGFVRNPWRGGERAALRTTHGGRTVRRRSTCARRPACSARFIASGRRNWNRARW